MRTSALLLALCLLCSASATAQDAARVVHVFVALCDNEHQAIARVPEALGDGDDPAHNLYWGALYGVKTFFARAKEWTLVATIEAPREAVLERLVFKHATSNVYLVADAYRGREIKRAIGDFLAAASGDAVEELMVKVGEDQVAIQAGGAAELVAYVGHNGLMEFELDDARDGAHAETDGPRDAVVLCCCSKSYFAERLRKAGVRALLLTTGLMAPEAYTLKAALDGWMANESVAQIRRRAAAAYDEYQECSFAAAKRLFDAEGE